MEILKLMNYLKENINPAGKEDYLEYELLTNLKVFISLMEIAKSS